MERGIGSVLGASGRFSTVAVAAFLTVAGGCGQKGPLVEPVEGIVLLDGAPLAEASVGFSPTDGGGLPGNGRTDARGHFRLTSSRGGRAAGGVPVGSYTVTVSKVAYDLGGKPPPADGDYSDIPVRSLVPDVYAGVATSPLDTTVEKGGGGIEKYRFELQSTAKATAKPSSTK